MSQSPESVPYLKRSSRLAILVGWLSQLGLKVLAPAVVLFASRAWSVATGDESMWLENPGDASHPLWFALQASIFAGSVVAGLLAGLLSPRRSFAVLAALVALSLLATFFEQFPSPLSVLVHAAWMGGPCMGLVVGYLLARVVARRG